MERRIFLRNSAIAAAGIGLAGITPLYASTPATEFTLPALPYPYNAYEPYIDELTMSIHHGKHHQAYVDNLNKALAEAGVTGESLENICRNVSRYSPAVRNNAGGHYNHSLFWSVIKPNQKLKMPTGMLSAAIEKDLGGLGKLREQLSKAAFSVFGSGWAWLVVNDAGRLEVGTTPNQDNPLMDISEFRGKPVLAIDVWEHAYYLKYQNRRPRYIESWWNLIDWQAAEGHYRKL